MWKYFIIIMVTCHFMKMTQSLTIKEVSAEDDLKENNSSTLKATMDKNYRKSVAKIQEAPHRVPEHLQFVPKGFIYEDADDVIHVIDPPKHFEELKKIMQRQEQRLLHGQRPVAMRDQRPKPKIAKTPLKTELRGEAKFYPKKPNTELDLSTQESQQLPLEILASVRKTENYLRKYKPKLPAVKQRLKTQKIQTVIWEKSQDQQQFQKGQEHKFQGTREQQQQPNRRYFNKKRLKRDIQQQPLKGEQLLKHINDLIQNASYYLEQTEKLDDYPDTELETTTLKGEILLKTTKKPLEKTNLNEDMVVKILENSVKATNVIMQQIKTQTNLTQIEEQCDYLKVTYPNHIKNLQHQIKCMQNFIKDLNQTRHNNLKKQAERLHNRRTKALKHKPFLVAQLAEDYADDTPATPVNSSLIYDDVMTTIRNMLHTQNLQSLEASSSSSHWEESLLEPSFTYDQSSEAVDFHNLQQYLTSLQTIVANLPKFSHKSLNLQEIQGGTFSKYYFINPQGSIYSLPQPFQKDFHTPPPSTIFHQFPDLPLVADYVKNGTLLPPSHQVVEIL